MLLKCDGYPSNFLDFVSYFCWPNLLPRSDWNISNLILWTAFWFLIPKFASLKRWKVQQFNSLNPLFVLAKFASKKR
jgi:hypothetical protein